VDKPANASENPEGPTKTEDDDKREEKKSAGATPPNVADAE